MNDKTDEPLIIDADVADEGSSGPSLVQASEAWPSYLPIFPLSNRPLFPGLIVPLIYEGDEMKDAIHKLADLGESYIGLMLVRDEDGPFEPENFFKVGVIAKVVKAIEIDGHGLHLVVECLERFRVEEWLKRNSRLGALVKYYTATAYEDNVEMRAYTVAIINTIKELLKHNPLYEEELRFFASRFSTDEPARLADFAAGLTTAARDELQGVLETYVIFDRMKKVITLLNRELNVSKVQTRIRENIEERVSEQQRKYFLNEQMHEIKRELGLDADPQDQEVEKLNKLASKLRFSEEAQKVFDEEVEKLQMLDPSSPEYGVTRNYLDWMVSLPWGIYARDRFNLNAASKALNKHHSGLDDIKERMLEFIAVGARKQEVGGSIILFVGPPGVGKTSLGKAISEAVNRPFFRFSVGGMRDEAEIKGHRRTYIGAMPGKIVQALKQVKAANPVIMIDEVDKIGNDFRGDPSSALLEVLDPEQNNDFMDHYLDVRFDLSRVLFLLTANQLDTVPAPLLDRSEIIRLPGYIAAEKIEIARKHLLPRQREAHGISSSDVKISKSAIVRIVEDYAREPGVRGVEQLLKKILRKSAYKLENGEIEPGITIGARDLSDYIGKPRFAKEPLRQDVGLATGLAWTRLGGVTLTLEVAISHRDRRGMKITGQVGKVMQESAELAYSYLIANLHRFGAPEDFYDKAFIHLHVPEGAVPKDGPSAGITMTTALLSLALGKEPAAIAMTGEMTLTGDVLAIGGVREKLLAAKRLGVHEVIIPKPNEVDVKELPESVPEGLTIHYAKHFEDVAKLMFGIRLRPRKRAK